MNETLLGTLILLPPILAGIATLWLWRRIPNRGLFFVVSALSLIGLQSLSAPAAIGAFLPYGGGPARAVANEAYVQGVIVSAAIQVTIGVGILFWLYRVLRKP